MTSTRTYLLKALLLLALLSPAPVLSEQDRPNILFAFADDWGCYASAYAQLDSRPSANDVVRTPHFDRLARNGVLFKHAFVTAPSCTPCRSSLLSGQYFFRTGQGAILQGAIWDPAIPSYPLLLGDAGYHIGETYKVWSPGAPRDAPYGSGLYGFEKAGKKYNQFSQNVTQMVAQGMDVEAAKQVLLDEVAGNFQAFLDANPEGKPFCYWFGPTLVHRKWTKGSGKKYWDINPNDLEGKLPSFLPDVHTVREDFADYLGDESAKPGRDAVFSVFQGKDIRSVRTDRYKLIRNFSPCRLVPVPFNMTDSPPGREKCPVVQLFDLETDPLEFNDLAEDLAYAEIRKDLSDRLWAWMESVDDPSLRGPLPSPYYEEAIAEYRSRS